MRTRKVDDLAKVLGADTGVLKSEASWICADLDLEVGAFTGRDLSAKGFPMHSWTRRTAKARVNHRVVSQAIVVAADGRPHIPHRERFGDGPAPTPRKLQGS